MTPTTTSMSSPRRIRRQLRLWREASGDWFATHRELCLISAIMLVAIGFRLFRLDSLPPGLHPEEAIGGLLAQEILSGNFSVYFDSFGGREGLFYYLQAAAVAAFGNSMLTLRMVPVVAGIAAVALTYLAARTWFSKRVAFVASFLMASSPWAVQFSRLAIRESLIMLFVPLLLWLGGKALITNRVGWFIALGATAGLSLYLHPIFYVLPLGFVAAVGYGWWQYRERLRYLWQSLLIVLLSMVVTMLPLLWHMATHTDSFFEREGTSLFTGADPSSLNLGDIAHTSYQTVTMFFVSGDTNYLHNLSGEPQINTLSLILFVLGLMLIVRRWRDVRYAVLAIALAIFTVPAILSAPDTAPNAARGLGLMPLIYILAGIGLSELFARWRGVFPRNPVAYHLALIVIVATFALSTTYNYQRYFVAWAKSPATYEVHHEAAHKADQLLREAADNLELVVIGEESALLPIAYLAQGHYTYTVLTPSEAAEATFSSDALIVEPLGRDQEALELPLANLTSRSIYSSVRVHTEVVRVYSYEE